MEYEGQICRPPMERSSFMLAVSVGCAYNRCKFCGLFKHLSYRELPMEQIESELKRVKSVNGNPKTVFLGDGNAFGRKTEELLEILELIRAYFPGCVAVNMDATVTDIQRKSDNELQKLYQAGIRELYLGIETGLADVLKFMRKEHTLKQAYEAIERMKQVGFLYNAHMMTGIAGNGRGLKNAEQTADFFNRTQPLRITNFSLFLYDCAPLIKDVRAGNYVPASELENLVEERKLIELLQSESCVYDGFHDFIPFRIKGTLPNDKEKMLARLDKEIVNRKDLENQIAYVR